ncbi:MAG TPA: hypothetical protein PKL06_03190 [Chitinophagales bacterium]|nr:hypothetical protein [Chitinophagales bacterium]
MKTRITIVLLISIFAFSACSSDNKKQGEGDEVAVSADDEQGKASENGRYGIRSGMYTSKTTQTGAPAEMDITTIVYFDAYGEDELTETVTKISVAGYNNETRAYSLRKGMMMYSWNDGQTTGTKMDISTMMDKNMNYEALSEDMKKQFNYKEIGNETILGKKCKKISMEMEQGAKVEVSTWKGIPMKSVANMMGITATIEVTDIQENPSGVADKLAVPKGITFSELTYPAGK